MKKNIPWRFGFTEEVPYAKTESLHIVNSLTGVVQIYPLNGFQL